MSIKTKMAVKQAERNKEKFMQTAEDILKDFSARFEMELASLDPTSEIYDLVTVELESKDHTIKRLIETLYDFAWGPMQGNENGSVFFNLGEDNQKVASDVAKETLEFLGFGHGHY